MIRTVAFIVLGSMVHCIVGTSVYAIPNTLAFEPTLMHDFCGRDLSSVIKDVVKYGLDDLHICFQPGGGTFDFSINETSQSVEVVTPRVFATGDHLLDSILAFLDGMEIFV